METLFALLPIATLVVMMGLCKVRGDVSSLCTLLITAAVALYMFDFSLGDVGNAFMYGAAKALFPILFIILMAIYSYNVLRLTGKIDTLRQQFSTLTRDRSIQVLLITWGFGGLLEGMAGFGTAVAIPAAILITLGYKPVFAAVVSLIANSVPTAFGAVGVPTIVLSQETGLSLQTLSGNIVTQLSLLMVIVPVVILLMTDSRRNVIWRNIGIGVVVGIVSDIVQWVSAVYIGAETPAILGSLASIIVITVAGKIADHSHGYKDEGVQSTADTIRAWAVYGLILVLVMITSPLFPSIRSGLSSLCVTTLDFAIGDKIKSFSIEWLVQGGLLLFVGSFVGGMIQGASAGRLLSCLSKTIVELRSTAVTVICLIGFSTIMELSGMTAGLATALATATGAAYPLFSPAIGALGTFLTGSDTSANIMFGKLQASVGSHIGVSPDWLAAANTAGATGGKIISPQSIAIATSACHDHGNEGVILKRAFPYALGYVIIAGIVVLLF